MRIEAHVIAVSDCGDEIEVTLQGKAKSAADWQALALQSLKMPATEKNKRAFHLGRRVDIVVTPR